MQALWKPKKSWMEIGRQGTAAALCNIIFTQRAAYFYYLKKCFVRRHTIKPENLFLKKEIL